MEDDRIARNLSAMERVLEEELHYVMHLHDVVIEQLSIVTKRSPGDFFDDVVHAAWSP